MLELDPHDPQELSFALIKAVRKSGLSLSEISTRLKKDYCVVLSPAVSVTPSTEEPSGFSVLCRNWRSVR